MTEKADWHLREAHKLIRQAEAMAAEKAAAAYRQAAANLEAAKRESEKR